MLCRHKASQISDLVAAIALIDLDSAKKKIIIYRYSAVLREYSDRSSCYSTSFHTLRITITVGSLIVPALLSVQGGSMTTIVYWCVWVLSLCVTISNGVMTLFKVDKKYYVLNTTFQNLVSEGWQYIELSGRYDGHKTPGITTSHESQFILFCRNLEKTRMKQVEDEYFRVPEMKEGASTTTPAQMSPDIFTSATPHRQKPFTLTIAPAHDILQSQPDSVIPPLPVNGGRTTVRRQNEAETPSTPPSS